MCMNQGLQRQFINDLILGWYYDMRVEDFYGMCDETESLAIYHQVVEMSWKCKCSKVEYFRDKF